MRSPNWSEEEVMLALDLYVNRDLAWLNRMSDSTAEIVGLSSLLNALDLHSEKPKKFRSTGSIRMKLANFMALDDKYTRGSLGNVGALDRKVWNEFSDKPKELHSRCISILESHLQVSSDAVNKYIEEMYGAEQRNSFDCNFSRFAKTVNRSLLYYEKIASSQQGVKQASKVIDSCKKIRELLKWVDNTEDIVFEYDLEYKEHPGINLKPVKNKRVIGKSEKQDEEKIGKLVRRTFCELVAEKKISAEIVEQLLSSKQSKDLFGLFHPFLIEIDENRDLREQLKNKNGYIRYWTTPIEILNKKYCVCKEWFENQRERYSRWVDRVNVHPLYMLKPSELKSLLTYLKKADAKKASISRREIVSKFPIETIEEILNILVEQDVLAPFQGSTRELVIDDYDAFYRMLNKPEDYSGE